MDAAELDADLRVETRAPQLARLISDRALDDTQRAVKTLSEAGRETDQPAMIAAPGWPMPSAPVVQQSVAAAGAPVAAMGAVGGGGNDLERWQEDDTPAPAIGPLPGMSPADLTRYTPGSHLHPTAQPTPTPAPTRPMPENSPAPKVKAKPGRKPGRKAVAAHG
jgi:hypothetical protein